jgi:hypothetical protein
LGGGMGDMKRGKEKRGNVKAKEGKTEDKG